MHIHAQELLGFLVLGLFGSAHCIGMCGGFAISLAGNGKPSSWRVIGTELSYVLGKALTYGVLGLLIAGLGQGLVRGGHFALEDVSPSLANVQKVMSWLAGGLVLWFGVRMLRTGAFPSGGVIKDLSGPLAGLRRVFRGALDQRGSTKGLATGLVTGMLPCGLSWGALALCIAMDPLPAMLCMIVFGLGTAPALVCLGLGWKGISKRLGARAGHIAGPILIVFGLLTILRGAPELMGPVAEEILPDCCAGKSHGPDGSAVSPVEPEPITD
jgi:uncharacterized protein